MLATTVAAATAPRGGEAAPEEPDDVDSLTRTLANGNFSDYRLVAFIFLCLFAVEFASSGARRGGAAPAARVGPGGGAGAGELARLLGARPSLYSSFECTAANQRFDIDAIKADSIMRRMCLLRDVCYVGGVLTYFTDAALDAVTPPNMRPDVFANGGLYFSGQVHAGLNETPSALHVVAGPRPRGLPVAPNDRLYLSAELSYPGNYAHLIMDTVLPAYAAAHVYGVSVDDVQHVGVTDCDTIPSADWIAPENGHREGTSCAENFERFYAHLLRHPYLAPPHADTCFRALVVGAEAVFSLSGDELNGRAPLARAMRARLHASYGVPLRDAAPLRAHHVVVWEKVAAFSAVHYAGLCADARAWAAAAGGAGLRVTCAAPATLTVREQLELVADASVIVAEHGSTTYFAMFARPGAAIVVSYPDDAPWAKETRTLLFIDVQAFYIAQSKVAGGQGPGVLRLALDRAGRRLGVAELPP